MERLVPVRGTTRSKEAIASLAHYSEDKQLTSQDLLWHATCIRKGINHQTLMNNQFESNYALLVRSEEKGRGVLEAVLYIAFVLSAVLLIWQFAQSPVNPRAIGLEHWSVGEATTAQTMPQG
jgi:hypothetical protein